MHEELIIDLLVGGDHGIVVFELFVWVHEVLFEYRDVLDVVMTVEFDTDVRDVMGEEMDRVLLLVTGGFDDEHVGM